MLQIEPDKIVLQAKIISFFRALDADGVINDVIHVLYS